MSDLHPTTRRVLDALEKQHRLAVKHRAILSTYTRRNEQFEEAVSAESAAHEEFAEAVEAWADAEYPGLDT